MQKSGHGGDVLTFLLEQSLSRRLSWQHNMNMQVHVYKWIGKSKNKNWSESLLIMKFKYCYNHFVWNIFLWNEVIFEKTVSENPCYNQNQGHCVYMLKMVHGLFTIFSCFTQQNELKFSQGCTVDHTKHEHCVQLPIHNLRFLSYQKIKQRNSEQAQDVYHEIIVSNVWLQ